MKEDFTKDPYLTYTLSEILGVRLISNDPSIFKTSEGGGIYYAACDPRWHYDLSGMNHFDIRTQFRGITSMPANQKTNSYWRH